MVWHIVTYWHHMVTQIWISIDSGNDVLPDGTKPSPEPILTDHQSSPVILTWEQFHKRCPSITEISRKNFYLRFHSNLPWANELKFWSMFCYTLHSCSQCCVMLACRITQLTLKCIFSTNLMLKIWRGPDNQITIYGSARQMHINTLMWQKQLTLNPFVPKSLSASTKKLMHEHLKRHGYILNTIATGALVLKHQASSIYCID